eukprot:tig00020961_g16750.t1
MRAARAARVENAVKQDAQMREIVRREPIPGVGTLGPPTHSYDGTGPLASSMLTRAEKLNRSTNDTATLRDLGSSTMLASNVTAHEQFGNLTSGAEKTGIKDKMFGCWTQTFKGVRSQEIPEPTHASYRVSSIRNPITGQVRKVQHVDDGPAPNGVPSQAEQSRREHLRKRTIFSSWIDDSHPTAAHAQKKGHTGLLRTLNEDPRAYWRTKTDFVYHFDNGAMSKAWQFRGG